MPDDVVESPPDTTLDGLNISLVIDTGEVPVGPIDMVELELGYVLGALDIGVIVVLPPMTEVGELPVRMGATKVVEFNVG